MELALAARDVLLVPRCAGCGEPGSWFCVACRDQCEPIAHEDRLALRAAGAHPGPLRPAIHRLKYRSAPGRVAVVAGVARTGATLWAAAAAARSAGARAVRAYVVAIEE